MLNSESYFVGVDVGTSSVRAALVDSNGRIESSSSRPIRIWEPSTSFYEQSSDDIWTSCCEVVKTVTKNIDKRKITGIGFDATCSLVALDINFQPITVSPSGNNEKNIIMWMDHRAQTQAQAINQTQHHVLKFVGGTMSLEMQPPKLLWLKKNLPDTWMKAGHFFDLPDYMTFRATGSTSRSLCSLVCKWCYEAGDSGEGRWNESFMTQIGLEDLLQKNYSKIGNIVLAPGEPVGSGLSSQGACDTGLIEGTPVGTSIIDAHAGGIGLLGIDNQSCENEPIGNKLAIICGTSSCHMAVSKDAMFVPGVWGPYYSAMVPKYWLNEGGQSASGKLIDFVIESHPAYKELQCKAEEKCVHIHEFLNDLLVSMATNQGLDSPAQLTADIHVWPDYHGNRSPLADSTLKGMICGLSLSSSLENLALMYMATLQAIAHGTKHIIGAMETAGHAFSSLYACGGLSKNNLFIQVHADVTDLPVVLPQESDCVLVGAAILGACAASQYHDVHDVMKNMCKLGCVVQPNKSNIQFYKQKYAVFLKMVQDQIEYRNIMNTR